MRAARIFNLHTMHVRDPITHSLIKGTVFFNYGSTGRKNKIQVKMDDLIYKMSMV